MQIDSASLNENSLQTEQTILSSESPFSLARSSSLEAIEDFSSLPPVVILRPNSRIIPQIAGSDGHMEVLPFEQLLAKDPPEPTQIFAKDGSFSCVRCPCEGTHPGPTLIRCAKCGYSCHAQCVGISRVTPRVSRQFLCPYCKGLALRCPCGQNMKYDEPIIKCVICGYCTHKRCAKLNIGRNPPQFICQYCGGKQTYPTPVFNLNELKEDFKSKVENREAIIQHLPEGSFKELIVELLNEEEISFKNTMERLFNQFAANLFDYGHEFWRTFVNTTVAMFDVERGIVISAMDSLATSFLYKKLPKKDLKSIPGLEISDSIANNVIADQLPKVKNLTRPSLLRLSDDGYVIAGDDISVGEFICELPGILCHQDEVQAEEGIPRDCISVSGTSMFIDVSQSTNKMLKHIKRSFHFNCIVKLQSFDGRIAVALYAARIHGPILEEKNATGPAIPKGSELLLPFDSDLPYAIEKKPWKTKRVRSPSKQKQRAKPKAKPQKKAKTEEVQKIERKEREKEKKIAVKQEKPKSKKKNIALPASNVELTLLSSFIEEGLSQLPIIIKNETSDDFESDDGVKSVARKRHMSHILKQDSDQE